MTSQKTAAGKEAARLCERFPDSPTRTIARRIAAEFSLTTEQARGIVRYTRGAYGKRHRRFATHARQKQNAGWRPMLPPSLADDWCPFVLDGVNRVGIISDLHIPYHSDLAVLKALEKLKRNRIDCLLINGDFGDWYAVSHWLRDPRRIGLKTELELQKECLAWIRSQFKRCRIVLKAGNHEERWEKYLFNHAPEICDLPQTTLANILEADKHGIEVVIDQRPVMAGELPILHGHELPKGIASPVNMARGAFMRTLHTVLVGHGHRSSSHSEPNMFHEETVCWSTGCLCDMTPDYARINKWNHGFAMVEISGQQFEVTNYRIGNGGQVRAS